MEGAPPVRDRTVVIRQKFENSSETRAQTYHSDQLQTRSTNLQGHFSLTEKRSKELITWIATGSLESGSPSFASISHVDFYHYFLSERDPNERAIDHKRVKLAVGNETDLQQLYYFSPAELVELAKKTSKEIAAEIDSHFGEVRTWEQANPSPAIPIEGLLQHSAALVRLGTILPDAPSPFSLKRDLPLMLLGGAVLALIYIKVRTWIVDSSSPISPS